MVAFWGILLLVAYGCFRGGGLVNVLDGWIADWNTTFIDPFPLLGTLKTSTLIGIGVLLLAGVIAHGILGVAKVAGTLVDTEAEMYKVTWPGWPETWSGTIAVAIMVAVLLLFLVVVDLVLLGVMKSFLGASGGGAS